MTVVEPQTHEVRGNMLFDECGDRPYWTLRSIYSHEIDGGADSISVEIEGEQWDVSLSDQQSGLDSRHSDDVDQLYEYRMNAYARGERKIPILIQPRLDWDDDDRAPNSVPDDLGEAVNVNIQTATNIEPGEIRRLFPKPVKTGDSHQQKVVLSDEPAQVIDDFIKKNRLKKHDENGREPLFSSRQGRPTKSTITNWMYQATQPCIMQECPHSKERHRCKWTKQTKASKFPSSSSPHPVRRGSITWQLNIGCDPKDVAARAATTPEVICRYYYRRDLDAELRRRITEFDRIDICEHADPTDVDEDIN